MPLWKDKKQFIKSAHVCVQMSYETFEVIGSEDCLVLNVFTIKGRQTENSQTKHTDRLMPVMFFIHGGSFNIGSSASHLNRPDHIVEKVIILTTVSDPNILLKKRTNNLGHCDRNNQLSFRAIRIFVVWQCHSKYWFA